MNNRVIFTKSMGLSLELVHTFFHWMFYIQILLLFLDCFWGLHLWCMLRGTVVLEFERRETYFRSLRAKLNLAPLGTPK